MSVAARLAKEKEEAAKRDEAAKNSPALGRVVLKRNTINEAKNSPPAPKEVKAEAEPVRRMSLNVEEIAATKSAAGEEGCLSVRSAIIEEADRIDEEVLNLFPNSPLARRTVKENAEAKKQREVEKGAGVVAVAKETEKAAMAPQESAAPLPQSKPADAAPAEAAPKKKWGGGPGIDGSNKGSPVSSPSAPRRFGAGAATTEPTKPTDDKAKKEAEEKAKKEEKAKNEAEEKAKKEAEEKVNNEAKDRANKEAEEKAKKEAEDLAAKKSAEEKAKRDADQAAAKKQAEEAAKKQQAEDKAKQEAEKKRSEAAKKETEEKAAKSAVENAGVAQTKAQLSKDAFVLYSHNTNAFVGHPVFGGASICTIDMPLVGGALCCQQMLLTLTAKFTEPKHSHSCLKQWVILSGAVTFSGLGGERITCTAGDIVFFPPGKVFSVACAQPANVMQTFFGEADFIFYQEN